MGKFKQTYLAVAVVALGYFVDILDLTLFSMVRVPSLQALGVVGAQQVDAGIFLLNAQMAGMLLGGFIWGILGDKRGRLNILFASILTYSLANLANAFVQDLNSYAFLRFVSGVGLAGELGVGVTLISELLSAESRGIGTTLVTTFGVLGAVVGGLLVENLSWRTCYIFGGIAGLVLLVLRWNLKEASLFLKMRHQGQVKWGSIRLIFSSKLSIQKLVNSILIGVPIWYVAGILMAFSPELAKSFGIEEEITAARTIGISYLGLAFGDLICGLTSQWLRSRLRAVRLFMLITASLIVTQFLLGASLSQKTFYGLAFLIGVGAGYWAVFVTIGAEQFGTNIRATIATAIPNLVRGSVIPMTLEFQYFKGEFGIVKAAAGLGVVVFSLAFWATLKLPETFGKSLDYLEGHDLP